MKGPRETAVLLEIAEAVTKWRKDSGLPGRVLALADVQRRIGFSPSTISAALLRPEVALSDKMAQAIDAGIPGAQGSFHRLLRARQEDVEAMAATSAPAAQAAIAPEILDALDEMQHTIEAIRRLVHDKANTDS